MNRLKKMTLIVATGIMMTASPAVLAQQETSPDQFLGAGEVSAPGVQMAKMEDSKRSKKQKPSAARRQTDHRKVLVAKK